MSRPYISKRDDWGDGKLTSWDRQEAKPKPKKATRYNRLCRLCGIYLTTIAEDAIGVHVSCVQDVNIRQRKLSGIVKSRPNYGTAAKDSR